MNENSEVPVTRDDVFAVRSDPGVRVVLAWLLQRERLLNVSIDCIADSDIASGGPLMLRLREVRMLITYLTKAAEVFQQPEDV